MEQEDGNINPVNWANWAPAVFSLLGVAVGTAGSLLGVHLSTRTAKEQARAQQAAALRLVRQPVRPEIMEVIVQRS
jgi:hypothetical protein